MSTLTETHRLAQAKLAADTIAQTIRLWPLLDPSDLDATYRRWLQAVTPVVESQRTASATLATDYYSALRTATLPAAAAFTPVITTGDLAALVGSLLAQGPWKIKAAMAKGLSLDRATELGMVGSARSASRHALDGGRSSIIASQRLDSDAIGFARVGSGRPCGFCAMLISRGPVYPSRTSALFAKDGGRFHDNCHCAVEPVFVDGEWQGRDQYEHFSQVWDEATRGLDGQDAVTAFRRSIDDVASPGRTVAREARKAETPDPLTSSQIADKATTHDAWARSAGWDTQIDGRRITGTKPDGARIVWELSDNGAWRVVERPS